MPRTQQQYLDAFMTRMQEECPLPLTFGSKNIMIYAFIEGFTKGRNLGYSEGFISKEQRILKALGAASAIPDWEE